MNSEGVSGQILDTLVVQPHGEPYQSGEKYLLTYHGGGATITESVQAAG